MWGAVFATAIVTSLLTTAIASILVLLILVPHIEDKVEQRIKKSISGIEKDIRNRTLSAIRASSRTIAKGLFSSSKATTLDPDEDPYLPKPEKDKNSL